MKTITMRQLDDMQSVARTVNESDEPIYVVDDDNVKFIITKTGSVLLYGEPPKVGSVALASYIDLRSANARSILSAADESAEPIYIVDGGEVRLIVTRAGIVTLENFIFSADDLSNMRLIELIMRVAYRDGEKTLSIGMIERRFQISYMRTVLLLGIMADNGFISAPSCDAPGEIKIAESEFDKRIVRLVVEEARKVKDMKLAAEYGYLQPSESVRESFSCNKDIIKTVVSEATRGNVRITSGTLIRRCSIGYARALRIIDMMCDCGFIVRLMVEHVYFVNVTEKQFEREFARLERELEV